MVTRRNVLSLSLTTAVVVPVPLVHAQDKWGASRKYPVGVSGGLTRDPAYRVGNYSGGFEQVFPHHVIKAPGVARALSSVPHADFSYRWGLVSKTPDEYLEQWPTTGFLICRGDNILVERYRMGRTPESRLTSWSMAKSVTSLLLGICIDRGLIKSLDDPADRYAPELKGTLHGSTTLRNLANMSSGAEVLHDRDNPTIYPSAFTSPQSSIARTVAGWNRRREDQGRTYNYNELCPLTVGVVIRKVTGLSMSAFAENALWQPMGAEADATWLTDSERNEFNCIGLAARLRDWARLGLLVADRGRVGDRQIVSEAWIRECTQWTENEKQARVGYAMRHAGYKAFMWHAKSDGSWLYFNGHHGQRVIVDMNRRTVLVQTAVDHEGNWQEELFAMFNAASQL